MIRKFSQGATLIEGIIYVAILGVIASTLVSFALTVSSLGSKNYAVSEVNANAQFIMDRMTTLIREADDVIVPGQSATTTTLELDMPATSDSTYISSSNGVVEMTVGVGAPVSLSSSIVEVTNLSFTNTSRGKAAPSVRISFDIAFRDAGSIEFAYSKSYQTTVMLRR